MSSSSNRSWYVSEETNYPAFGVPSSVVGLRFVCSDVCCSRFIKETNAAAKLARQGQARVGRIVDDMRQRVLVLVDAISLWELELGRYS
jgi:hypothetical protein